MKKTLIFILFALGITIIILGGILINRKFAEMEAQKPNIEFETILSKEMYGTDIVTLINKARNNNEKYKVPINEDGYYENDNNYSIQIEINFIGQEKSFSMEQICKAGLEDFMQAFNISKFTCTQIEYHLNTSRIAKIVLQEI